MSLPAIMVHGGAGGVGSHARERAEGLRRAAQLGWDTLERGQSAVDAVIEAVADLESDPVFNAGIGSVLTSAGTVEMDASVMDGRTLAAGAVGAVSGICHPIRLARAVLDHHRHLLIVGDGARRCAAAWGVDVCDADAPITEEQRRRWREQQAQSTGNTVGAVAVDRAGHVAAATSTGGVLRKAPGRVGDSALIGAGTYADDIRGAASATGLGEAIITVGLARQAADFLRDGLAPQSAVERVLLELADRCPGDAGLIVVDRFGRLGYAFNTAAMPVAWRRAGMAEIGTGGQGA